MTSSLKAPGGPRASREARAAQDPRTALDTANVALGDLRITGCALLAAANENDPLDEETRQTVLHHAAHLVLEQATALEAALDCLEDCL